MLQTPISLGLLYVPNSDLSLSHVCSKPIALLKYSTDKDFSEYGTRANNFVVGKMRVRTAKGSVTEAGGCGQPPDMHVREVL